MKITSKKVDKKTTKQVRIDSGLHRLLKIEAARSGISIKELVEGALAELLAVIPITKKDGNK